MNIQNTKKVFNEIVVKERRWQISSNIIMAVMLSGLSIVLSIYVQEMIDEISMGEGGSMASNWLLVSFFGISMVSLRYFWLLQFNKIGIEGREICRNFIFKNILFQNKSFGEMESADLLSMVMRDGLFLGLNISQNTIYAISGFISVSAFMFVIAYISIPIAFITIGVLLIYIFVVMLISKKGEKLYQDNIVADNNVKQNALKGIEGIDELTQFKLIGNYCLKRETSGLKHFKVLNKYLKNASIISSLNNMIRKTFPLLMVIILTIPFISKSQKNLPIFTVYVVIGFMIEPLELFFDSIKVHFENKALFERVSTVLMDKGDASVGVEIEKIDTIDIELKNFSYDKEKYILNNFKLNIKEGEIVVLKGESGSGKSTLLDIITGNLDLDEEFGFAKINGEDIKNIKKNSLYDYLLTVRQKNFIFQGTLRENLCMGDEYSNEQIDKAIEICCLKEYV